MPNASTRPHGDFAAAFRRYEAARCLRTARVHARIPRICGTFYHADGIARDVYWQTLGERTEADMFQCLAWLYDGFALPTDRRHRRALAGFRLLEQRDSRRRAQSRFYWLQRESVAAQVEET